MRVLVSAGEPSGDTHAAGVVRALLRTRPDAEIDGIGGPQMEGAGAHLLERMERLSASGLVEVTGRAAIHVRLLRRLRRRINVIWCSWWTIPGFTCGWLGRQPEPGFPCCITSPPNCGRGVAGAFGSSSDLCAASP
jgi:hypothetical protein